MHVTERIDCLGTRQILRVASLWIRAGLVGLIFSLAPSLAGAQLTDPHVGLTIKAGTTGAGLDLTKSIFNDLNIRVGYNRFEYSDNLTESGIRYDGDLTLESIPFFIDWHAFSGGFRLSAGAFYNNNRLDLISTSNGPVTIGNTVFTPTQLGSLRGDVDFGNPVVPYLGIGWGNAVDRDKRWGVSLDLGVFYQGTPDVTLNQTGGVVAVSQADLDAEEKNLEDDLDDFEFYPVATIGIHFRF